MLAHLKSSIAEKELMILEKQLSKFPNDVQAQKNHSEIKQKMEIFLINETEGARIRAGQKWAQEGEKKHQIFP